MTSKINNVTYNIDKLPLEVVGMLDILFRGEFEGYKDVYMVEVKIDDPMKHIKEGDEFFIMHKSIDQYIHHAEHLFDKEWAVIHKKIFKTTTTDENRFKTLLNTYFETGVLAKTSEPKPAEVKRTSQRMF